MTPPDLAKWLQQHSDGDAVLSLGRDEGKAFHDELSRLRQSSDRLRKQNNKMRRRIEKLKNGEADEGEEPTSAPAEDSPDLSSD